MPPAGPGSRWQTGGRLLGDERLRWLEILLDEAFRIPGTQIRFGLDGIIGLVPGLGDVLAGLLSLLIPLAAWVRGVPYITLVRMLINVSIGLLVGTIPIFGDASTSSGRPTGAITGCSPAPSPNPTGIPGEIGDFCCCSVRGLAWFSPFRCCLRSGCWPRC